jgi:hypothetical protein
VTIDKTSMVYYSASGAVYFKLDFATGAVTFNSGVDKTKPRYEITASGIRLYPTGTGAVPSVLLDATTGNASFSGDITGSNGTFYGDLTAGAKVPSPVITGGTHTGGTITGATIQTSAANPRIFMTSTSFQMNDVNGGIVVRFLADSASSSGAIHFDTVTYPRFYLDTTPGTGQLAWWPIKNKPATFQLDFHDGSITLAGPIVSGATITASTFQTAATGARILFNSTQFVMYDDQGNLAVRFLPGNTSVDGSILLDTGPDHYPRFTINSGSGLYWYNAAKAITFSLTFADGAIKMTGPIVTAGTITGAAIQTGGSGARIIMDPNNGLRAYKANGDYSFYATMAGTAFFSGTVSASDVNTPKLNGGSIAGVTFGSGNSGGTFASPTLNQPTLGGTSTNTGAFTGSGGGSIVSGTGSARIVLVGSQIQIFGNNAIQGLIEEYSGGNDMLIEGYGAYGSVWLGYNNSAGSGGGAFSVSNGNGSSAPSAIYGWALQHTPLAGANYVPVYVSPTGAAIMGMYTSSVRHKKQVQPLGLDPRFMDIETATWAEKPNRMSVAARVSSPGINRRNTGFTAENLHRSGMTDLVVYDAHHRPQAIQQPAILAHTVAYVQHLVRQVQDLTARVAALEGSR